MQIRPRLMIVLGLWLFTTTSLCAQESGPDWIKVTADAGWRARDSSGELVFQDKLWLFGGWFDSFQSPPRDVWSSADGKAWALVEQEAPWKYSDLPMTLTFKGKMWFMGGWTNGRLAGHGATNEVWSSTDGKQWSLESKAGWSPRIAAAVVEFKGRMWMLGGTENYYFGDKTSLKNDVWSSADGKTWEITLRDGLTFHGRRRLVAARVPSGGGLERQAVRLRRWQLCPRVSRDERCLVFERWQDVGTRHRTRGLVSATVVLVRRLSRPDVGLGRLVERAVEKLG